MPSRRAKKVWDMLLAEAGGAAVDEAARVTVAEAERDLAKAGFDVEAERRKAVEQLRKLGG
jgi:hypothetical protein